MGRLGGEEERLKKCLALSGGSESSGQENRCSEVGWGLGTGQRQMPLNVRVTQVLLILSQLTDPGKEEVSPGAAGSPTSNSEGAAAGLGPGASG